MSTNGDAASAFSHPSWWDEEVQSQDTHHSTEDLYAAAQSQEETMTLLEKVTNSQETPKRMNRKERIKWQYQVMFDDDLENILNSALHAGVERKIRALPEIIFGAEESKSE